jgi:rubrerythrin
MDLFRKAGEKFEQTKRTLVDGDGAEYVCRSCGETATEPHEYCPHCGEQCVEPVD